jgi:predicted nuclease of predicted toxin-antitoxin system
MRIKVDEDLPSQAVQRLRGAGYDASGVLDQDMGGWTDSRLWQAVQAHGEFLVTADKGFGDIRVYPPETHGGVLLLRPNEDGIRPVLDLLDRVLAAYRIEILAGLLTVATPRGIRIRRARRS